MQEQVNSSLVNYFKYNLSREGTSLLALVRLHTIKVNAAQVNAPFPTLSTFRNSRPPRLAVLIVVILSLARRSRAHVTSVSDRACTSDPLARAPSDTARR